MSRATGDVKLRSNILSFLWIGEHGLPVSKLVSKWVVYPGFNVLQIVTLSSLQISNWK
jgi:hypothetical protein